MKAKIAAVDVPLLATLAEEPGAPVVVETMETVAVPAPADTIGWPTVGDLVTTVAVSVTGGSEEEASNGRVSVPRGIVFIGLAPPSPKEERNAEERPYQARDLVDLRQRDHRGGWRCGGKDGFSVVSVHLVFFAMRSPNHHPTQLKAAKFTCSAIGARSGPTEWK